jgi:hypothetical protein
MSSNRRIQASRANGAKSRGPVTPEGRTRSSLNAIRHGLTARCLVLGNESVANFEALLASYVDYWKPANDIERDLVEEMVAAKWRQHRIWKIETAAYDMKMERQEKEVEKEFAEIDAAGRQSIAFNSLIDDSNVVDTYVRYESRMSRIYDRAFARLEKLKKSPNEPNPDFEHQPPDPESVTPGLAPSVSPLDAATDTVNVDINKPGDDSVAADSKLSDAAKRDLLERLLDSAYERYCEANRLKSDRRPTVRPPESTLRSSGNNGDK